jgi:hypothetical protein
MLDRCAGSATLVHEDLHVVPTAGGVGPRAFLHDGHRLDGRLVVERAEGRRVVGRDHDHLVRAVGTCTAAFVADDGVEVRYDAHSPPGRVRRAGAEAEDLRWCFVLVAGTERARRRGR